MKKRKGQVLVEFALIFPFFILIVIGGIIDFGFAFYNQLTLQQIANNTAKYAAFNRADGLKIAQYATSLKPKWWEGNFTLHPSDPIDIETGGKLYKVALSYNSPAYTPFYKALFKVTNDGKDYINIHAFAAYKAPEYTSQPLKESLGDSK